MTLYLNLSFEKSKGWNKKQKPAPIGAPMSKKDMCLRDFVCVVFGFRDGVGTGQTDVVSDDVVEIGGTWLSPAHSEALRLAKEYLWLRCR